MDSKGYLDAAEEWLVTNMELDRAFAEMSKAKQQVEQLTVKLKNLDIRLHSNTGENIRTRVYRISDTIVIVEHERAVRAVLKERING